MKPLISVCCWPSGHSASGRALDVPAGDLGKIQQAAPGEAPAKAARPRRLLVFTLAKGYVHEATPWGVAALAHYRREDRRLYCSRQRRPESLREGVTDKLRRSLLSQYLLHALHRCGA